MTEEARLILLLAWECADDYGWADMHLLHEMAGMHIRKVENILYDLEDLSLIELIVDADGTDYGFWIRITEDGKGFLS